MDRSDQELVIEVEFELLSTEQGGRRSPIAAEGYRPLWKLPDEEDPDPYHDGMLSLSGVEELTPGARARGEIRPLAPEFWIDRVEEGDRLVASEGAHVIGYATVLGTKWRPLPPRPSSDEIWQRWIEEARRSRGESGKEGH